MQLKKASVLKFKSIAGLAHGFGSVLPYSIIPLLFLIKFTIPGYDSKSFQGAFTSGLVLTMGKDFLSLFFFAFIVIYRKEFLQSIKMIGTKGGVLCGISAIFGSSIGYTCFNTAFYLAGPSFSHIFSALEPIILVLMAFLFLKRKFKWQMYFGIFLTVAATASLVAGGSMVVKDSTNIILGSLLGILGAISWAIEAVVFDKAITVVGEDKLMSLLFIKMFVALTFSFVIMFPTAGALVQNLNMPFQLFSQFFTNPNYLWRFLLTGSLIIAGRFMFFSSVKYNGATLAQMLYNLTIIVIPVLNLIVYAIGGEYIGGNEDQLTTKFQIIFWTMVPIILIGTSLTIFYKPQIKR